MLVGLYDVSRFKYQWCRVKYILFFLLMCSYCDSRQGVMTGLQIHLIAELDLMVIPWVCKYDMYKIADFLDGEIFAEENRNYCTCPYGSPWNNWTWRLWSPFIQRRNPAIWCKCPKCRCTSPGTHFGGVSTVSWSKDVCYPYSTSFIIALNNFLSDS